MSQPYPPFPPPGMPYGHGPVAPPLDKPYYGISFGGAMKRFFAKYATFSGRASRSEYWWVMLGLTLFILGWLVLTLLVVTVTGGWDEPDPPASLWLMLGLLGLLWLGVVVPSIAIQVRRLHDANLSGWFWLMNLIPYAGGIIMLVFMLLGSKPEGARFDDDFTPMGYGYPGQPPYPPPPSS